MKSYVSFLMTLMVIAAFVESAYGFLSECPEGGCDMTGCTKNCSCDGGCCYMPDCVQNCSCRNGQCDMSQCTAICGCTYGLCDMSSCVPRNGYCGCPEVPEWEAMGKCAAGAGGIGKQCLADFQRHRRKVYNIGLPSGAIAGIVVGTIILIAGIIICCCCCRRRRKQRNADADADPGEKVAFPIAAEPKE